MDFLLNTILPLIIPLISLIAILSVVIRAIILKTKNKNVSILASIGKLIGNSTLNILPKNIMGARPNGHFTKPNFSYDEKENTDDNKSKEE